MIEMRVRHQDHIHGRKILHVHARIPQPFQKKQPRGKIRIDDNALPANLQNKAGMPDERDPEFAVGGELRLIDMSGARCDRRMSQQAGKLSGALSQCRTGMTGLETGKTETGPQFSREGRSSTCTKRCPGELSVVVQCETFQAPP